LPAGALLAAVCGWEAVVRINDIPPVILPSPSRIVDCQIRGHRLAFPASCITRQDELRSGRCYPGRLMSALKIDEKIPSRTIPATVIPEAEATDHTRGEIESD